MTNPNPRFIPVPEEDDYVLIPKNQFPFFLGTAIMCMWKGFWFTTGGASVFLIFRLFSGGT